jgi:hypothetical protein
MLVCGVRNPLAIGTIPTILNLPTNSRLTNTGVAIDRDHTFVDDITVTLEMLNWLRAHRSTCDHNK